MIIHNIRSWEAFNNVSYERELLDYFERDDAERQQKASFTRERTQRYARNWTAVLPRREAEVKGFCLGCCGAPKPYENDLIGGGTETWLLKFEDLVKLNVEAIYKEGIFDIVN